MPSSEDDQDDMMQGQAVVDPITGSEVIEGAVPLCIQAPSPRRIYHMGRRASAGRSDRRKSPVVEGGDMEVGGSTRLDIRCMNDEELARQLHSDLNMSSKLTAMYNTSYLCMKCIACLKSVLYGRGCGHCVR